MVFESCLPARKGYQCHKTLVPNVMEHTHNGCLSSLTESHKGGHLAWVRK